MPILLPNSFFAPKKGHHSFLLVRFFATTILLIILLHAVLVTAAFTATTPRFRFLSLSHQSQTLGHQQGWGACGTSVAAARSIFKATSLFEKLETNNLENADDAAPLGTKEENTQKENRELGSNALSALQQFAQKSTSKIVTSVSGAVGSGVKSAVRSTSNRVASSISGLATGTSRAKQYGESMASGLVQKGTSKVNSVANSATTTIRQVAQKGTTDVKSVTGAAMLSLTQLTEKGTEDTVKALEWMDSRAKDGASAANNRAKDLVFGFTGKNEYQFGDVTKELVRRILSAEYSLQDMMLLLRVLLAVGASCTPLAKLLPLTMLLEMLNTSLEARLGGRILEVVAGAVDERVRAAFTAEELGDLVKKTATSAILSFTGKETYKSGDIQRAAVAQQQQETNVDVRPGKNGVEDGDDKMTRPPPPPPPKTLQLVIGPELEDWDQAFRQSHPDMELAEIVENLTSGSNRSDSGSSSLKALDAQIACELEAWDKMFLDQYPDSKL